MMYGCGDAKYAMLFRIIILMTHSCKQASWDPSVVEHGRHVWWLVRELSLIAGFKSAFLPVFFRGFFDVCKC